MKIFFTIMLIAFSIYAKANQLSGRTTVSNQLHVLLKQKTSLRLELFQYIESFPAGYAGPGVTYWIVYDSSTGDVAGYGAYNQCYPVSFA